MTPSPDGSPRFPARTGNRRSIRRSRQGRESKRGKQKGTAERRSIGPSSPDCDPLRPPCRRPGRSGPRCGPECGPEPPDARKVADAASANGWHPKWTAPLLRVPRRHVPWYGCRCERGHRCRQCPWCVPVHRCQHLRGAHQAITHGERCRHGFPHASSGGALPSAPQRSMVLFQRTFQAGRLALMLSQSTVTAFPIHWLNRATSAALSPLAATLGLGGICAPNCSALAWPCGPSRNSATFCASSGSLFLAITHCAVSSITAPSLGCAYSTGMPLSLSATTAVGVSGNSAASPVCTISEILAELAMYSNTFGPMVWPQALKPGSTFLSLPPCMRLNIMKPCSPKVDEGSDWNTTRPLYLWSARSIHEAGAAQPLSANILVL